MKLEDLEYTNFVLKSLITNHPLEIFVFSKALHGLYCFLDSNRRTYDESLINNYRHTFEGIINVLKIYYNGGSCVKEIVEVLYNDFIDFINEVSNRETCLNP